LDASVLERSLPFGESPRSTKRTLYGIQDPALRFWFRVYSPHRSRWHQYSRQEKQKLLRDHTATVFEDYCRNQFPDAARYWEADLEFDLAREDQVAGGPQLILSEVKWTHLGDADRQRIAQQLEKTWQRSALRNRYSKVRFEVLDSTFLKHASRQRSKT
jgi:AAA+ ATPase superfamily predicted ATPase